jgi:hypothetical protein
MEQQGDQSNCDGCTVDPTPKTNTANAEIKVRILLSLTMLSFQAISLYGQASLAIVRWLPKPEMVT